jgi:phosphoglycerate dehydrogenase-like enzyme
MPDSVVLQRPRVLLAGTSIRRGFPERLRERGWEVLEVDGRDRERLMAVMPEVDIAFATPSQGFVFDGDLIEAGARLRAINSMVIGVETIDVEACTEAGVIVANGAVAENFIGVAEATVMLMVALSLDLKAKERALRRGDFRPPSTRAALLHDRTIGLIGFGRIGRAVVERLQGWGVRVLVYDPYVKAESVPSSVMLVELDELLKHSDFVSVHVALTPQTRGLLGRERLALMKPTAYLLNNSRGHVVDESALVEALNTGRLAAAAIDTWAQEPIPNDHPLLNVDHDKLILTGHCIGHTAKVPGLLVEAAIENAIAEARGEVPPYAVNPHAEQTWRARLARLA